MRTYEKCHKHLNKNVIKKLDPDIFIHTWEKKGKTWKHTNEDGVSDQIVTQNSLDKYYSPVSAAIEEFDEEYYNKLDDVQLPEKVQKMDDLQKGMIPMFYKMHSCNELKKQHENENGFQYDLVILTRPDLAILDPIPDQVIDHPNVLWVSNKYNDHYRLSDQFTISSSENIDYFTSIWDNLNTYWESELGNEYGSMGLPHGYTVDSHKHIGTPERLLHYHIKQSRLETAVHGIRTHLLRSGEVPYYRYIFGPMRDPAEKSLRILDKYGPVHFLKGILNRVFG